jgi:predicted Fe-S protein YdhL (DUF1289 family)
MHTEPSPTDPVPAAGRVFPRNSDDGAMDDVPSPCIGVCVLDQRARICRGCRRTIDEIAAWSSMTDAAKRAVLRRLVGPSRD